MKFFLLKYDKIFLQKSLSVPKTIIKLISLSKFITFEQNTLY